MSEKKLVTFSELMYALLYAYKECPEMRHELVDEKFFGHLSATIQERLVDKAVDELIRDLESTIYPDENGSGSEGMNKFIKKKWDTFVKRNEKEDIFG